MAELAQAQQEVAELRQQIAALQAAGNNQNVAPAANAAPAVNALYRQPKIASFSRENPSVWFSQAEITLRNAGITTSATKADFIAEKLDMEAFEAIKDIVTLEPSPRTCLLKSKTN